MKKKQFMKNFLSLKIRNFLRKVTLGRTQIKVSSVSLGTWAFGGANMSGKFSVGWSDQSKNNSKKTLTRAWELNINHWDTADVYGDGLSESIIGEMWDDIPRDDIIIATKVGWDKGPNSYWYDPDHMPDVMVYFGHHLSHRCPLPSPPEPWPLRYNH